VSYKNLVLEIDAETAVVTLNRPDCRNALSLDLMLELLDCLGRVEQNRSVRAVILAAAGKVYCAGHDLREMTHRTVEEYRQTFTICTELMTKVQSIPQPVIAEIQGTATAAGCQLVASCDLAVASDRASFATPGVRIGLFCTTPMVALSRAIGRKRALQMLLTGESIDAATAEQWGLINCVVPEAELRTAARKLADRIAQASPLIVDIGKQAYYTQIDLDQAAAYTYAREVMTKNAMAADAQEGMAAFLEKRRACWSGK
jgi:enoyl-CoA hydratase/carnithine racemase